ncbi:hypothetical protein MMC21_002037 [Puttea exsequens]|nr:hypothetical protein [Puttea exsequens]
MQSSIGSDAFALLALALISIFVLLLLRHFLPLRTTPAYLTVPIFLALALPISIILLVPVDLASSSRTDDVAARGIWLPDGVLLVAWRLTYWLTFALTWFILPLLGEYADSGYRTPKDRILHSLRSNGRYQLIVVACAAAGGTYVFLQNGFKGGSVKSLVMALAYCWGLIMAIYLMGHGLVAVPRKLIRNANHTERLKRIRSQAPRINDKLNDATRELEELEFQLTQLRKRKSAVSRDHEEWIEELSDASYISDARLSSTAGHGSAPSLPAVITDRYLAELTRKMIRARHKRVRFVDAWDRLIQEAVDMQAIINAVASKKLDFGKASPHLTWIERLNILTPYTRYLVHTKLVPAIRIISAAIFSVASVCIVWSELVKYIAPKLSIISLSVLSYSIRDTPQVGFGGQVIASLWLFYMSMTALASFDDVKIWGNRALVKRNTYGESAAWYSGQIAKLTVPLAYNFLTFFPPNVHKETAFYHFLGRLIDLTPLGAGFDYFFPIFILIPVCATLFNLYGRVKHIFGFGILEDDEEGKPTGFSTGGWQEGRDLIDRELHNTSRLGLSSPTAEPGSPLPSGTQSPITRAGTQPAPSSSRPSAPRQSTPQQRQAQRLAEATAAAEEEDENFFQGFAHRVKNTLDNVDRPDWVNGLGKRPKWMGGVEGNTDSSGRADSGRGLGRWFGGRPADGRVRL